jgi:hypothetical protein
MTLLFTRLTDEVDPNHVPVTYTVAPKISLNSAPKGYPITRFAVDGMRLIVLKVICRLVTWSTVCMSKLIDFSEISAA